MEIVTIEKKTFDAMMQRLRQASKAIETLRYENDEKRMSKWLDNQDVCRILGISLRTLQTFRDNGTLAYSQIGHKMFYKPEDVQRIIQNLSSP